MTNTDGGCDEALPDLVAGAARLGLTLSASQRSHFTRYCSLLVESSARMNLTAVRSPPGVMRTLFLDSLTVAPILPARLTGPADRSRVVDIGSGAGVPGIPLKILYPQWNLTLVESVGKKARFLDEVTRSIGLADVQTVNDRAEVLGRNADFRDRYDLCLARAVAPLPALVELCGPFVRPGGVLAFPKGADAAHEAEAARAAAEALRIRLQVIHAVPEELLLGAERFVVLYVKVGATPRSYPRRVGLAQSRPLQRGKRPSH